MNKSAYTLINPPTRIAQRLNPVIHTTQSHKTPNMPEIPTTRKASKYKAAVIITSGYAEPEKKKTKSYARRIAGISAKQLDIATRNFSVDDRSSSRRSTDPKQ